MSDNYVQIASLERKNFVGVAVTSSFQNVKGIREANRLFMDRRNEIQCMVNDSEYVCLHFSNEVAFTYIYCMQVSELDAIPNGMIGFTVPSGR
ncbi:GyrI-like domain-containing protein [Paenibacillus alkalitolerans]|uniref:GyrI-like domain-containing protein n=1 Tax=Paenibacillus alkalitolerans TaxID=2799335 RepID=UPI0018F6AECC|nr:GyrI-like domain-containing protein [Paenibacillus alkalitolerans]